MVNKVDKLSEIFAALADPTRRKILQHLRSGESRMTKLAEPFRMSLPAISKHVRVLEKAGLVTREKQGREHRIRADPTGLKKAQQWMAQYVEFWDRQFDALDDYLKKKNAHKEKS